MCLLRGTDWVFKENGLDFVPKFINNLHISSDLTPDDSVHVCGIGFWLLRILEV